MTGFAATAFWADYSDERKINSEVVRVGFFNMCLLFVRPPQNWKCAMLNTLLFAGAENTDKDNWQFETYKHLKNLNMCWMEGLLSIHTNMGCNTLKHI
jgi:hypothetical protein